MKAAVVNKIFSDLSEECNKYPDGVHMNIDMVNNATTYFCICGDTVWNVDVQVNLLTLESNEGTEWIDTDSITRIHI